MVLRRVAYVFIYGALDSIAEAEVICVDDKRLLTIA